MLIEWDVEVPVDDGLVLRADVFRPDGEGRVPAILTYGPYGKGLAYQDGYPDQWRILTTKHPDVLEGSANAYQNWEAVDPERFVPAGYACVRVDSRGAGRSPGFLDPWSMRETQDLYDCIEWAAAQPWCNGRVGMCGISYYAMNQWQVAALQPPHLAAICVWEGAADFYRDTTYHGGIRCINWGNWYAMQVTNVQHGVGDRGPVSAFTGETVCGPETLPEEELAANRADFYADVCAHPLDDDWHRDRSPNWEKVTVPLLSAGAWGGQALHLRGNVEGFVNAASPDKWLELHGGEHWASFSTQAGVASAAALLRPLPQGRAERLGGFAAACAAQRPASRRHLRAARRVRVAARADELDDRPPGRRSDARARRAPTATAPCRSTRSARASSSCRAPFEQRDRADGAGGLDAPSLFVDARRGRLRDPPAVRRTGPRGGLPGLERSRDASRQGVAARVTPQARPRAERAVPPLPHSRRGAAARARRDGAARRRDLAAQRDRPRRVTGSVY